MKNLLLTILLITSLNSFSQGQLDKECLLAERIELKYYLKAQIKMSLVSHSVGVLFFMYKEQHQHLPSLAQPLFIFNTIALSFDISIVSSIFKLRKNKNKLGL